MPKSFYRHKILLDENMDPRQRYPRLNEHFDVKHIEHDLKMSSATDPVIYHLAVSQGRIIVTRNNKHFRPQVGTEDDAGGIAVPPHWTPDQIDSKLTAILMRHGSKYFASKFRSLATE